MPRVDRDPGAGRGPMTAWQFVKDVFVGVGRFIWDWITGKPDNTENR